MTREAGTSDTTRPRLEWTASMLLDEETRNGFMGAGAPFELVDGDVLGSTVPVFAQQPASVRELIGTAASHGDRPFLTGPGGTVSFDELPAAVDAVAARLARRGVGPGDRVLLAGATTPELILTLLGTMAHGAVAAPANPAWTATELERAVVSATPTLVVVDDQCRERLTGDHTARDHTGGTPAPVLTLDNLLAGDDPAGPGPAPVAPPDGPDDPCALVFTSGTTATPRGALLSHRNALHFCRSAALTSLVRGLTTGVSPEVARPPTVIASAPMFHVSGLLGQLINALSWGLTLVVAPPGRWDADTHLELTETYQVTSWTLVPTQLRRIVDHPDLDGYDLRALTMIGGGGAPFPPDLLRQVHRRLPHVRAGLRIGYGMTETAGTVTLLEPPVADHELGSVGRAVAGAEIEIRSPTGDPLPAGRIGQIWARSASVFLGYWDDPDATAAVLDADRWYATGDYGRIEGDVLYLESRLRDLIIRGGENIYPIEIENRLVEHPAVTAAAVVGVPDRDLGQVVKAVVVTAGGARLSEDWLPEDKLSADEVREWVGAALARYKVPAVVEFRTSLPVNASGKVVKRDL